MKPVGPEIARSRLRLLVTAMPFARKRQGAHPPKHPTIYGALGVGGLRCVAASVWMMAACFSPLGAQQGSGAESNDADRRRAADTKWQDLEARQLPPTARGRQKDDKKTPEERKQETAGYRDHFLSVANDARAFRKSHGDHPKSGAVRLLEARSLLKAQMLGAESQEERSSLLVEAVKGDESLPRKDRYEVVMMAEHLLVRSVARNRTDASAARKESARYLILEFPEQAGGYLSLLQVADATEDIAKIKFVADEIRATEAPFVAKAQAEILVERYALIGKSLADVANTALGRDNFFEQCRNKRVLLYTWGLESKQSMQYAKERVGRVPSDVLVIGYNLDRDVAAAQAAAAAQNLPGRQYYNEGGIGSWLALLLKLNSTPLVYLTDAQGIIRDVNGQRGELADRIAARRTP